MWIIACHRVVMKSMVLQTCNQLALATRNTFFNVRCVNGTTTTNDAKFRTSWQYRGNRSLLKVHRQICKYSINRRTLNFLYYCYFFFFSRRRSDFKWMRSAESTTTFYVYFMNQLADQLLFFCVFVVLSPENILFFCLSRSRIRFILATAQRTNVNEQHCDMPITLKIAFNLFFHASGGHIA